MKIFNPHIPRSFATKSLLLVCVISTLAISSVYVQSKITPSDSDSFFTAQIYKQEKNPFEGVTVEAKAVYVYDVSAKKILYEKNPNNVLPLASITKVMTALVAQDRLRGQKVTINSDTFGEYGDNKLLLGDVWNFKNLIGYLLTVSSNDGARAVASAYQSVFSAQETSTSFEAHMNAKAKELELNTMTFNNPTGLDLEEQRIAGGYGSAKDVAKLFEYILKTHPDLLLDTKYSTTYFSSDTTTYKAENTDIIINQLPNPIASKTGYTNLAGGSLAVVFDKGLGEPVIIVILGSSFEGRFSDVTLLAQATMEKYNNIK